MSKGILFLLSGPSGSGKTTLCQRAAYEFSMYYAKSATTRQPRAGEEMSKAYHFLTVEEFKEKSEAGEFLESAEVHGNFYGTLRSEILPYLESGKHVVMDIDVQGARQIRADHDETIQAALVDLFVCPDSRKELEARLRNRSSDSEETIQKRLAAAIKEAEDQPRYRYTIASQSKHEDWRLLKRIIHAEEHKSARQNFRLA